MILITYFSVLFMYLFHSVKEGLLFLFYIILLLLYARTFYDERERKDVDFWRRGEGEDLRVLGRVSNNQN